MPFLRYIIILLLLYILYRLVKASIRGFFINLKTHRDYNDGGRSNVRGAKRADLDDIEEAKYEEIKDDAKSRKD